MANTKFKNESMFTPEIYSKKLLETMCSKSVFADMIQNHVVDATRYGMEVGPTSSKLKVEPQVWIDEAWGIDEEDQKPKPIEGSVKDSLEWDF